MSEFWLNLFGVDPSIVPQDADLQFAFTSEPRSWVAFVLVAAVIAGLWGVFFLYRREHGDGPRWMPPILAVLRALVLLLLLVILMGPALTYATQRTIEPYVVLLVDESFSMSIRDRYPDPAEAAPVARAMGQSVETIQDDPPTRAAIIQHLLTREDRKMLRDLSSRGKVRVISFDRDLTLRDVVDSADPQEEGEGAADGDPEADAAAADAPEGAEDEGADDADRPIEQQQAKPLPPIEPSGQATDIGRAIREGIRSAGGAPIAGVVLITDGQRTEGEDPVIAARFASQKRVPIYTVGVGGRQRNLRVGKIASPRSVFQGDKFDVRADLLSKGFYGRAIPVRLVARRVEADGSLGPARVLDTRTVQLPREPEVDPDAGETDPPVSASFGFERDRIELTEPGEYALSVEVDPLETETFADDNQRQTLVSVLSEQPRVLLIAGAPSWEYRLLSILLKRDPAIDVSGWLQTMGEDMQQVGNTVIEELPQTRAELFEYDVVIFIDPNPDAFDTQWIDNLNQFVSEHGGGLVWVAGPKFTEQFFDNPLTSEIKTLLPITTGRLTAVDVESLVMTHDDQTPLRMTAAGTDHPIMKLFDDPQKNRLTWEQMPGIFWSYPAQDAKPGAITLVRHRDYERPLIVAGQYGAGNTMFIGFTGTWRWNWVDIARLGEGVNRRPGIDAETVFTSLWVNVARNAMAGRTTGDRGKIDVEGGGLLRDVFEVGQSIKVNATLYDATRQRLEKPVVEATFGPPGGGGKTFELTAIPGRPGEYEGSVVATEVGINEIAVALPGDTGIDRIARQITVDELQVETNDPQLDRKLLEDIAAVSDGRYFEVDQVDALAEMIPSRTEVATVAHRPIALWDAPMVLGLLVLLLTLEWAGRKRMKML